MSKKTFLIILFIGVLFVAGLVLFATSSLQNQLETDTITDISININHQTSPDSKATTSRVLDISPLALDSPEENALVTNPFVVVGSAPSSWYSKTFTFTVVVEDGEGNILGQGVAKGKNYRMISEFERVSFEANLTFKKTDAEDGYIVFKKDNSSGDPKNDKEVRLPVTFKVYLQ